MYELLWSKRALKDAVKIEKNGFKKQVSEILATVRRNPYEPTQQFEKFGRRRNPQLYSRRINIQHRFVYMILQNTDGLKDKNGNLYEGIIGIVSMWSHYE
jgi:Txe/YoeB family toxin of toxin-antitoxin system